MSSAQKTPIHRFLPRAARQAAIDEIKKRGSGLPCHIVEVDPPALVTVAFDLNDVNLEQVSIPIYGSVYQWQPFQVGDKGFTVPLSVDLYQLVGLGPGLPNLQDSLPATLSNLFFLPAKNTSFATVADVNKHDLSGPNGFTLRDSANKISIIGDATAGTITFTIGEDTWVFSAAGFQLSNGVIEETHSHFPGTYNVGGTPVTDQAGLPKNP